MFYLFTVIDYVNIWCPPPPPQAKGWYCVGQEIHLDFSVRCYEKNPSELFGQPNTSPFCWAWAAIWLVSAIEKRAAVTCITSWLKLSESACLSIISSFSWSLIREACVKMKPSSAPIPEWLPQRALLVKYNSHKAWTKINLFLNHKDFGVVCYCRITAYFAPYNCVTKIINNKSWNICVLVSIIVGVL